MPAIEDAGSNEDILAALMASYEEQLLNGTLRDAVDSPIFEDDSELAIRLSGAKSCLELLHRVRTRWTPHSPSHADSTREIASTILPSTNSLTKVGRFEVERILGGGGFGLVYLARDPLLDRHIALKVPRFEAMMNDDMRMRFLREAEAAARLNHSNIVSVHESGQDDLLCYIVMEYCEGPTLAEWLRSTNNLISINGAVRIARQLSVAVQHAHSRGVLHRDIKPGNVLLVRSAQFDDSVEDGQIPLYAKLTDFGMAKILGDMAEQTHSGAMIGTPAYMAPEQAAGRACDLDTRTDVYALGVLLYELLVGCTPFRGESPVDTLRRVIDEEPKPPRHLRPQIPRDLEAICLKCLAKRPSDRYPTAQQLSDDLDRYLAKEPIVARRPGMAEALWKWARRRPILVSTLSITAAALVVLVTVIVGYNARLSRQVVQTENARQRAQAEAKSNRQLLYSADIRLAQQSLNRNNVPQALELLQSCVPRPGEDDFREFTWHYLRSCCEQQERTLLGHIGEVFSVAYSPDGGVIASAGKDRTVRLWNASTGQLLHVLRGHSNEVTFVDFSNDGQLLASASDDGTIRLWNWHEGIEARSIQASNDQMLVVTFSPDGRYLAAGGREPIVRIWDLNDWSLVKSLNTAGGAIHCLQFTAEGSRLICADQIGHLNCWNSSDWKMFRMIEQQGEKYFALDIDNTTNVVAAAGRREDIQFFREEAGEMHNVRTLPAVHSEWIQCLSFNKVDSTLASAGKDGAIRLWSPNSWQLTRTILGHSGRVWSIAWSPDGRHLASAGADGQVRIWNSNDKQPAEYPPDTKCFNYVGIADLHDGKLILTCNSSGVLHQWDIKTHDAVVIGGLESKSIDEFRASPNGDMLAKLRFDGFIELWQRDPLKLLWVNSIPMQFDIGFLAWSQDNEMIAGMINDRTISIFQSRTGKLMYKVEVEAPVWDGAFLPDHSFLISTSDNLYRWNLASGKKYWSIPGTHHLIEVSSNGRYLVAEEGSRVAVIEAETGKVTGRLIIQGMRSQTLAISPDGRTIAIGTSSPSQIECWDLHTCRELITLPIPKNLPKKVMFTRDCKRLFALTSPSPYECQILEWSVRPSTHQ